MSQNLAVDPASSSSTPCSPPPSRPRFSPPSERDLLVYKRVKIWRDPQWAVAVELQLHYSRVSQIVKKVEQWLLAGGSPTDPEIRDHVARRRLSRADHKLRLQRAVELATAAMEAEPEPQTIVRRRTVQGTEVWREETTRQPPAVNLGAVRLLVRATEALHKLEEQEEHCTREEPLPEHDLLPAVFELLCQWRTRAEADGRLPATPNATALVASALNGLLGTQLGPPAQAAPPHDTVETASESSAREPLNLSAEPEAATDAISEPETSCDDSDAELAEKFPELERPNWATAALRDREVKRRRPERQKEGQPVGSPSATTHSRSVPPGADHQTPLTEQAVPSDDLHRPPHSNSDPTAAQFSGWCPPSPEGAACT